MAHSTTQVPTATLTWTHQRRLLRNKGAIRKEEFVLQIQKKDRFGRKPIERKGFDHDDFLSNEELNSEKRINLQVDKLNITIDCATCYVIFPDIFKFKKEFTSSEEPKQKCSWEENVLKYVVTWVYIGGTAQTNECGTRKTHSWDHQAYQNICTYMHMLMVNLFQGC